MTWAMLWAYFSNASNEIKRSIWEQLDLVNFLRTLSQEEKNNVMEHAPGDVKKHVNEILSKPVYRSKLLLRLER